MYTVILHINHFLKSKLFQSVFSFFELNPILSFSGRLIVADAYHGLYRVDVKSGAKEVLVPSSLEIEGKKNLVTNSIAITKNSKTVYYTTSRFDFLILVSDSVSI